MDATAGGATVRALEGGNGPFVAGTFFDLAAIGYEQSEHRLHAPVRAFRRGPAGLEVAEEAEVVTRILVHRPADPAAFDGTVAVEWLNVSAGLDAAPVWLFAHRELVRRGSAWVGVSAQHVGIHGGSSALDLQPMALQQIDPERYGALRHPGDRFSFDLFTTVGALARHGEGTALAGLDVQRVLGVGESQSAFRLTTYVNEVDPVAGVYDGFFVHARGGPAAPLDEDGDPKRLREGPGVPFADDLRVPVLCVESETDLITLGYRRARRDDHDRLVVWEVAGTAHADVYTLAAGWMDDGRQPVERLAEQWRPVDEVLGTRLDAPINVGPQHYVVQAALRALDGWAAGGPRPPSAPPLVLEGDGFALDEHGNALGGVRTPHVEVPTARLSGLGNGGAALAFLVGTTRPFDRTDLVARYGTKAAYLERFTASAHEAVAGGFLLADDLAEILAIAAHNVDL